MRGIFLKHVGTEQSPAGLLLLGYRAITRLGRSAKHIFIARGIIRADLRRCAVF